MKNRFIVIYTFFAAAVFIFSVTFFGFNLYKEYSTNLEKSELKFTELVNDISVKKTAEDLGKVQDVLVEDIDSHDETFVTGRTEKNYLVHFKGDASLIGEIVSVKLVENKGFYYIGERV